MTQAVAGNLSGRSAAGKTPELFELKSASLSLLALVLKTADPAALDQELTAKLGETPDAFHHDPLLLDLSQLPAIDAAETRSAPVADSVADAVVGAEEASTAASEAQGQLSLDDAPTESPADAPSTTPSTTPVARVDLAALLPLLRRHRLQPVGVVGANAAELAQAAGLGLAEAPDEPVRAEREPRVQKVVQQVVKEVVVERQVEVAVPAQAAPTVYVDKPLRSGQQVYAKGADLVVLAAVNHGAEVIADGSIHVYAPLRGKAIAGARGNAQARIFAQQLEAELIAIAGIYRTSENPLPDNVRGKAAQVRLDGEKLLMEPLGA
ncbi:septum site-determining protein MinC [Mitsuaria sp. PDC51]|uniref:septum site-determining protein MinC n=1 Tax=unclassified Roseateles TaxID=2626991 RepID=UPI0008E6C237|nr:MULTISPECIES: septum site-determining protein MinC [unclassified Roseateles]MBB3280200.1 septum site-determining protein MinC [Mitsuaria sp. BK037]MBB3292248.1 septum site-determining protein MinC [Mitsuaria sp. BK041]MBB3361465.1 septum site-determining protein MinC [Mitsuaria sp. BK045]SFR74035.1 septum site-determining protein MinC [Mitsuaria sp. PDC51]